ncbi:two-component system sensor histidine kinase KdpD [Paenibacillus turicensis]|uniref:histidine kinase n=1 Tax=Paenibacillus turicensis TaxID=160487 RepID=A0ABS4FX30_9BACL|nr:sensor histidine kinase KdpD [Paenibacillus turicensis]MBP1907143.1 two-component system sensor histidine kinase KdpD [Paenibacillus turicensis]
MSHQPEDVLQNVKATRNQANNKRGALKIFIGFSPGVGKTFTMLCNAHKELVQGRDVIIGCVQNNQKYSLESLLQQFEHLPFIEHHGMSYPNYNFDLDRALARKPQLIVLDNLGYRNKAGSRHKKRYQDIEELLQAGIDVYTTLNIQQLESLTDIVSPYIAFSEPERIPDHVLDGADFIEFIDCDIEQLMTRYEQGLIFKSEKEMASYKLLFQKERLLALREIALRTVAQQLKRIASQQSMKTKQNDESIKDHLLVCVSAAESNKKVIRTAARMAEVFHARFTALYVETTQSKEDEKFNSAGLRDNFRLAEQLGAQIATVYGDDIPLQITEYVKTSRVSKIVLGRSPERKRSFSKTTIVDKLIGLEPNIETYIIPYSRYKEKRKFSIRKFESSFSWMDAFKTTLILLMCTLAGLWFQALGFREANIITVFILGALINAMVTQGRLYSGITSIISVLIFNFLFTAPRYSFQAYDSSYIVTFVVMLIASFMTSTLTIRVRKQARQSAQKAYRTEVLLETSRKLQQANSASAIMEETARQMVKLLDKTVAFYPVHNDKTESPILIAKPDLTAEQVQGLISDKEYIVADWVLRNNKSAGATTDTFSNVRWLYFAVRSGEKVHAVAAIDLGEQEPVDTFQKSLMIAMLGECALALDKEYLSEHQKSISLQIEQEQLRANLLRGISHDLRTPLTSISGNAGILISNGSVLSQEQVKGLYADIYDDSVWLNHLVENVLAISRIENGVLNFNFQIEVIEDVILEALQHVKREKANHIINMNLPDEILMAAMDSRLIVQVLINLIDNAIKYTEVGTAITISARQENQNVLIEVADLGAGIPDKDKPKIFETFYTLKSNVDGRRSLGLGLSLCKSIIEAHEGKIGLRDHYPCGTVFWFTLPAAEVNFDE